MPPLPESWNPSYETGLHFIDQEHAALLTRLNTLIELLSQNAAVAAWLPALDALIDTVTDHFTHEEQIMDNVGFPGFHAHRQQHQYLLQDLAEFRAKVTAEGSVKDTLATVRFLKFWVLKHMVQEDTKIGQYVHRGLPQAGQ
jgi:hemerythrin